MEVTGTQLVVTPHPVTLEGQRFLVRTFEPGENLGQYLGRTVPDWADDEWEVRIDGHFVPSEWLDRLRPKDGVIVEVRGVVHRQALAIVALAALTYFTFGIGAYGGALASSATGAFGALGGTLLTSAVYLGGAILINKVLGPKLPKNSGLDNDPVYSISSARNQARHYQPLPILFGTVRVTPDVISAPYLRNLGDDQFLSMGFTPGVNVYSVEALYNGDTALSTYENTEVLLNGFAGHADDVIPIFTNVDTTEGGELDPGGDPVVRTSSTGAIRLQVDLEGVLYRVRKGKIEANGVVISVEYAPASSGTWSTPVNYTINNDNTNTIRRSFIIGGIAEGQYDVRVTCQAPTYNEGQPDDECAFTWTTLGTVQRDTADYAGIPRIWVTIKASGQINGALDEIRCVAHSTPVPVWDGADWNTEQTSNPGAHLLAYARGIEDEDEKLIAGMGLADTQIDIAALQAFMLHCAANGYTYDAYIKDPRNHQEMVDTIALAGMGQVTWSGGKFSVVWAAEDQPVTAVANMANIKRGSFQVGYTLASGADGVEYAYVDAEDWQTKTLRVAAPGVETMLNPAQVTGEGVTSEAHAAEMARYHLAQSLYQYKDISFAQDLEHLSFRRLSVLSVSHDLTQWGYSGRLVAAVDDAGTITVTLDEPVPAPASGTPYIGLRVPGEGAYRVFEVEDFEGTATELVLVDPWPGGVDFPGDSAGNPFHDTIWCYDFQETPGARVRVVQIEPESDLRGARIAVVPETEEFWTFVKEGEYLPPPSISLLVTVPTASNLQIAEVQVSQAGILGVELLATFNVTGPLSYAAAELLRDVSGDWVATGVIVETRTPVARLRVPSPGTYLVRVRPFSPVGRLGTAVEEEYEVTGTWSGAGLTVGGVLNDDPFFNDPDAWVLYAGSLPDFVDITDGAVGGSAIRTVTAGQPYEWINGRRRIPVDHTRTYRVSGWLRTASGSGSVAYLGVALFDESGANIAGDGSQWFYAASAVTPPGTFTRYSGTFGANTAKTFPSEARTMAPLVLLTYNPGGGPHTSVHEAQDLRIEDQSAISVVAFLTNEAHTLPADSAGNVSSYSGASGSFKVFAGSVDVSASFALSTQANPQSLTVGYTDQAYSVTAGMDTGEDVASLTIRATGSGAYSGITIDKVFSLSKSRAGAAGSNGTNGTNGTNGDDGAPGAPGDDGADAKLLYVYSDRQTINYDGAGSPSPSTQTTTFTAQKINTTATVTWSVQDVLGNALTPATSYLSSATGDSVTMTRAQFDAALAVNGAPGVIVTGTLTDGVTLTDKISVLKVQAGANGSNGSNGSNGTNGSDGSNGLNVATVTVYQRAISTPSVPSATVTFTFASGAVSGLNNGWSATIPADNGLALWATSAPASSSSSSDTIGTGEWTTPVVLANGIADIVNISSRTVDSVFAAPEDSYAAWQLNSNGTARWGSDDSGPVYGPGQMVWLTPQTNMANYEVRATVLSGSLTSGTTGSWLNLGTTRSWYVFRGGGPGTTSCVLFIEVRRTSDNVVVEEATITLNAST